MTVHYHGTPVTPRLKLYELAGKHFCVSFADRRDVEVCHEIGQSVMLDNGAFSLWTAALKAGATTSTPDWSTFYEWVEPWLDHWTTWAVIPDVIDGDEAANDALIAAWPFGARGAPVWHLHESLERLDRLTRTWPLVCIGSSGAFSDPGSSRWDGRMHEAMAVVCDERGVPRTRLHMLRGLKFGGGLWPFFSLDSTNVANNHAGSRKRPARPPGVMATELDARQCAARWAKPREQLEVAA